MKKYERLLLITFFWLSITLSTASAGQALSDHTSYKQFGGNHYVAMDVMAGMSSNPERFRIDHNFDMVYEETNKKNMRLEALGLNYDGGKLVFLEFPEKDNGVYVSFNKNGQLDAVLLEIKKDKQGAVMFAYNEVVLSLMSEYLLSDGLKDHSVRDQIMRVITGTQSVLDLYIDNKGYYVRLKDVHAGDSFYRVAIYRPEA